MISIPFNEFDEAHRAEQAKRMKEYGFYYVPLTGSSYDRDINFRIPFKDNLINYLYFHIERPPLVYNLMIFSTSILGTEEWAFRLPSLILGILSILVFVYFAKEEQNTGKSTPLLIGLLALITSSDLWLSSQYAQLDTGLTTFLFLALLSLIAFADTSKKIYLVFTSIGLALAVLSKGQPAIFISLPIIYLLIIRKLKIKYLILMAAVSLILLLPWLVPVILKFGLVNLVTIFFSFVATTLEQDVIHHKAPIFWYVRWWWESFRPGWILFLALVVLDIVNKKLDWRRKTLLSFIFGSLALLSIPESKLWWYVLPIVPLIAYYVFLSLVDQLRSRKDLILNLAVVIIIASRAPLSGASNKVALFYGIITTALCAFILYKLKISVLGNSFKKVQNIVLILAVLFSLASFYLRFPKIIPYDWNIKPVAKYFSQIPGSKCLWIYDMPPESALFYSEAGEIHQFHEGSKTYGHCTNYLITPSNFLDKTLVYQKGRTKLYLLENSKI